MEAAVKKSFSILIVDDEVNTRELYADVFREEGFAVSQANDGLEALELATQNRPDIVFTGIIMPRMDGFSLAEALKKNVATADVPVVFSSHLGRFEDKQKAEALGARGFFVLGVTSAAEVVSRVEAVLSGGEYTVKIDAQALDVERLAEDLDIQPAFGTEGNTYVLKLKVKDLKNKTFDAELVLS